MLERKKGRRLAGERRQIVHVVVDGLEFAVPAIQQHVIEERIPYYRWPEINQQWQGKGSMREFFAANKGAYTLLLSKLKTEAA